MEFPEKLSELDGLSEVSVVELSCCYSTQSISFDGMLHKLLYLLLYLPVAIRNSSFVDQARVSTGLWWPFNVCVADPDLRSMSLTVALDDAAAIRQCFVAIDDIWWQ